MRKKIIVLTLLFAGIFQSLYASTLNYETIKDNTLYREFTVEEKENNNFFNSLEDVITKENIKYKKIGYDVKTNVKEDTININNTKSIISDTNNITDILNKLPKTIEYNSNGYVGSSNLDISNIKVSEIYNGYYEEYIEDTKQYFDLDKNDMNYIPKEIKKDGHTLYLINVKWYPQTTKYIGSIKVTDLYRADAYYKGVKRIYNPTTYNVVASYTGIAKKELKKQYSYIVKYNKIEDESVIDNNTSSLTFPIVAGTSGIFIIIILFYINFKKAKVYNLQCGKYIFLGNYKVKNGIIDISKIKDKNIGNKFKIILNNKAFKLYNNKDIKIIKNDIIKTQHVVSNTFEITI